MPLSFKNDELQVQEYVYDFSVDGGDTGTVTLSAKDNKDPLPAGAIVTNATAWVQTAGASGGSATLSFGLGTDVDGLLSATAVGSLTENAVIVGDSTAIPGSAAVRVADAAGGAVTATIAVAALTAGKVSIIVEYLYPQGQ